MLSRLSGRFFGLLLAFSVTLLPVPAWCAPTAVTEPTLTCTGVSTVDLATKEFVFPGDARLTYGDLLLTADEIRYNQETKTAAARGHVIVTRGDNISYTSYEMKRGISAGTVTVAMKLMASGSTSKHTVYFAVPRSRGFMEAALDEAKQQD